MTASEGEAAAKPWLPAPVLVRVGNFTPLRHLQFQKMGKGRVYYDCLVFQATYALRSGRLALADEQAPLTLADEYSDDASDHASLSAVGALHLPKPGTDVVVTGDAEAPGGAPTERWTCEVRVQQKGALLMRHAATATGPRFFLKVGHRKWEVSTPRRTASVPIRYELAYGGHFKDPESDPASEDGDRIFAENPSGVGYYAPRELDEKDALPAPQWEDPERPVRAPSTDSPLVGFGPIPRTWASRGRWGGTFDDAWLAAFEDCARRGVPPDYPADMDARYFHAAHPALQSATPLRGDERIELVGFVADAPALAFSLPGHRVEIEALRSDGSWDRRDAALDLVHIDLARRTVVVTWRIAFDPSEGISAASASFDEGAGE